MATFQATIHVYLRPEIGAGCSFAGIGMSDDVASGRRHCNDNGVGKMRNSSEFNESI